MGDEEMMRIINRLTAATVTADVRADMLVEDEFFSAIEDRDTALMIRDKKLAEKEEQLKQNEEQLKQNVEQLRQREELLAEKDKRILTMAKMMLDNRMDLDAIKQATGLTQEQIDSLK